MKILHAVEYYYPSMGGAQEIVRRISEYLVTQGHDVTVVTTQLRNREVSEYHGVTIKEFDIKGNWAKGFHGDIQAYRDFVRKEKFDLIMLYAAQQWTVDALLDILPTIPSKKVFVPCGFSGLSRSEFHEYFQRMPNWLKAFDHLVFLSHTYQDIRFAQQHKCTNFTVIPNGAAEEEFDHITSTFRHNYHIPKNNSLLLTVGSHTGVKGHSFAMRAFTRAKIENATLVIIGNTPLGGGCKRRCELLSHLYNQLPNNKRRNKNILLIDPPRQDVLEAYKDTDLFLFASNIEASPLVLFEAMASSVPFLTLDVGNSAEIIHWSQGGVLARTRKKKNGYSYGYLNDYTKQLETLYNDPELRKNLGNAGNIAWKKNFTIAHIGEAYENLYHNLIHTHATS